MLSWEPILILLEGGFSTFFLPGVGHNDTSGSKKVSGQKPFYTKNGQFHALILALILELKIG